jgi:hypothetical protein
MSDENPIRTETGIDMNVQGERKRLIVGISVLNNHLFWLAVAFFGTLVYFGAGFGFYMGAESMNFTKTIYFLTQTITTVGYGDAIPKNDVARIVTCFFMIFGVVGVAAVFSELTYQIFCVHRDKALKETLDVPPTTHEGKNAVVALLDHQIALKQYTSYWMLIEIVVLIIFGVILISLVEDWDISDSIYWAVQTLFTVGYGDFRPKTTAGHWVAIIYMFTGCFLFVNIMANLATLPQIYHRRSQDIIVLSQFDPQIDQDTCHINDANEALATKLNNARINYSGDDESEEGTTPMVGHSDSEHLQLFGKNLVNASDENINYLKSLCQKNGQVTRDEFSLWLLHLLGRIDSTDIMVVRDVYDKFASAHGSSNGAPISLKDIETFSGSSL